MLRDLAYIERRAREERQLAIKANSPRVRDIHLEFAARYEDILRAQNRPAGRAD